MFRTLIVSAISLLLVTSAYADDDAGHGQKAVLITGASTGIGRNLAESLAADGHFVYAGARKDADLAELDAIENIKAVRLDVTKQDQIDAAVAMVEAEGRGLWGLVNNAGVGGGTPVAESDMGTVDFVYSVNVDGVHRVTTAFAPLIIESKGRISTTGSIAGVLSGEGYGVYSGTKHAVEAMTDALADELADTGVAVSVVEPGSYQSHIRRSSTVVGMGVSSVDEMTAEQKEQYERTAARETAMKEPDEVTEAFKHALFSDAPLRRYMVVPNEEQQALTIGFAITKLVQHNQWGPYSYTRDELVQMLDEALAAQEASD